MGDLLSIASTAAFSMLPTSAGTGLFCRPDTTKTTGPVAVQSCGIATDVEPEDEEELGLPLPVLKAKAITMMTAAMTTMAPIASARAPEPATPSCRF
jgi:hypothetical protein